MAVSSLAAIAMRRGRSSTPGGSLSFDKYGASELIQLAGVDDKDNQFAGLSVRGQDPRMNNRIWVGRKNDGVALVSLMDAEGRKRLTMQVAADGTASLDFLDAAGHVVRRLSAAN